MIMKGLKLYNESRSLITRLTLLLTLLLGGATSAWADDPYVNKLTFENSSIPSGWSDLGGSTKYDNNYLTATASYSLVKLTSSNKVNLVSGQKIVIVAQTSDNREGATYGIRYEHKSSSSFNGTGGTVYSGSTYFPSTGTDYTITINIESNQNDYIAFWYYGRVKIKSIDFQASEEEAEEITELTFDENADIPEGFSSLTEATSVPDIYVKYTPVNGWNTICMPFQLKGSNEEYSDIMNDIFGEERWKAYSLKSYADGVLSFKLRTQYLGMSANTPYLVYTTNPPIKPEVGFNFQNIDITYSTNLGYNSSETNGVTFQGTYAPKDVGTLTGCYGVTSDGHIAKGGSGAYMKGYRAYFTGITDSEVKMMILEGDDETDLGFVKMVDENAKDVYTLTGQKVQKGRKGIYIVNGKKVVIK